MFEVRNNFVKLRSGGKILVAGSLLAALTLSVPAWADSNSNDALLNKLVEKGILSAKEAEDLKKEADSSFTNTYRTLSGMPDWVTSYKLYGDFRGRFEENNAENSAYFTRDRYRYRVRLGLNVTMIDQFDIGLRVASGNPQFNSGGTLVGGSPVTANQDLNSLESRKFLWIDAAYAKWTPIKNNDWLLSGTIGKMDNPFLLSNMIWDYDIDPEGAALQVVHNFTDKQTLKGNAGAFVLDELNQGNPSGSTLPPGVTVSPSRDPFVYGAQVLLESKWSPIFESSLGVAAFAVESVDSLSAKVQPFYNSGNSRDVNGFLKNHFNPIIGTASATYKLDSFPLYKGAFPIKVSGEYMNNPAASANNEAYRVGLTLGKSGKKHAWEINYRYQRLEADAWFDALVDDDNGAYYATGNPQLAGTGKANGWFGGTNVKGHQFVATYSFTDFLNFNFIYYANDLIISTPGQSSRAGHFMAEFNLRY
jgi:hypothetical protein